MAWSSSTDKSVGTLKTLTAHALKIIKAEATREIPTEPHCPQLARKTLPQLGSPTVKVEELDSKGTDNIAALKAAAEEERARREANGIGDRVQNRQPVQPPPFDDTLVGRRLEVRYRYDVVDLETKEPTGEIAFLWCSCEVLRVSDGTIRKVGAMGQELKSTHPAGHVLLRWDANEAIGLERLSHPSSGWACCPQSGTQTSCMRGVGTQTMECGTEHTRPIMSCGYCAVVCHESE